MVQAPLAAKVTGSPEDALAVTLKSGSPSVLLASLPKVIDCDLFDVVDVIENVCETSGAAANSALPACEALTVHEPGPVRWTVAPLIVQAPVALKATGSPDEALAATTKSGSPTVFV